MKVALRCGVVVLAVLSMKTAQAAEGINAIGWHADMGLGAVFQPSYEGSDTYQKRVAPIANIVYQYEGGKVGLGVEGLKWSIIDSPQLETGVFVGYTRGRYQSDDSHLSGLGDIKRSALLGGFGEYRFGPAFMRVTAKTEAGYGHGGSVSVDAESGYRWRLSEQLSIAPSLGLTWANVDYMDEYFGVTAAQSARSGLAAYTATAGIKDVFASVKMMYQLDKHWKALADYRAYRLTGDAADSPITERKNQQRLFLGVGYAW